MKLCYPVLLILLVAAQSRLAATEYLYIHNTFSGEVSKISIPGHEVVGEIEIGLYMDYVNKSPDNRTLYVNRINGDLPGSRAPNIGVDGELIAIDTATDKIKWRLEMDGMTHHMSVSKDGKLVFVPYYDTWWVAVVDVAQRKIIKKIWIRPRRTRIEGLGQRQAVVCRLDDERHAHCHRHSETRSRRRVPLSRRSPPVRISQGRVSDLRPAVLAARVRRAESQHA